MALHDCSGSLNTPDCKEAVRWIVVEKTLQITNVQVRIKIFEKLQIKDKIHTYFRDLKKKKKNYQTVEKVPPPSLLRWTKLLVHR